MKLGCEWWHFTPTRTWYYNGKFTKMTYGLSASLMNLQHIFTRQKRKRNTGTRNVCQNLSQMTCMCQLYHPHAWYWYAKNHSKATMSVLRTMIFNSRNCKYMWELGRLRFLNLTSSSWQCRCRGPTCVITIVHSHNQTGSPWTCSFPAHPIHKQNETKISELNRIVWSWKLIQEQSPQSARLHALEPANKLKFI